MSLERSSPGCHLKARCFAVGGAMIAGLAALVVQRYRLQIDEHRQLAARSEANFIAAHAPRARRPRPEDHSQARAAPPRR